MAIISSSTLAFSTPEMGPTGPAEVSEFIQMDIQSDSRMKGTQVTVKMDNGIALLTGTVKTMDQSERAAERAMAATDVRAVVNQIQIAEASAPDSALKESVARALKANPALDAKRVTVRADRGNVVLGGEVGTWDEQEIAREITSNVPGVMTIENHTQVVFDSVRTDSQIQEQLRQLIANDPLYDGLSLSVSVKEGVVRLKGEVGTKGEYDRLVRRTSVTGVFEVNADKLSLNSDLKMEAMGDKNFTPDQILVALGDAFRADTRIDPQTIEVRLAEGVVTLSGTVTHSGAKFAAESTARGVPGVIAVSNQLRVHEARREMATASVNP